MMGDKLANCDANAIVKGSIVLGNNWGPAADARGGVNFFL